MNKALSFEDWVRAHGQRTELALDNLLDAVNTNPARLHEAMRYAAQGGGKRIRPLLVYAAGALSDDANQKALDVAENIGEDYYKSIILSELGILHNENLDC